MHNGVSRAIGKRRKPCPAQTLKQQSAFHLTAPFLLFFHMILLFIYYGPMEHTMTKKSSPFVI